MVLFGSGPGASLTRRGRNKYNEKRVQRDQALVEHITKAQEGMERVMTGLLACLAQTTGQQCDKTAACYVQGFNAFEASNHLVSVIWQVYSSRSSMLTT